MARRIPVWLIALIVLIAASVVVLFHILRDSPETQIRESIAAIENCLSERAKPGVPFSNLDHADHLKEQLMEELEIESPGYIQLNGKVERALVARRYFMWRRNHPDTIAEFSQIDITLKDDDHADVRLIATVTNRDIREQFRIRLSYVQDGSWKVGKIVID